jgi:hypothetical protein
MSLAIYVILFMTHYTSEAPKTVVFIYTDQDGSPDHADGTGFLMYVPVPSQPELKWTYLITAKHVVYEDGDNPPNALQFKPRNVHGS